MATWTKEDQERRRLELADFYAKKRLWMGVDFANGRDFSLVKKVWRYSDGSAVFYQCDTPYGVHSVAVALNKDCPYQVGFGPREQQEPVKSKPAVKAHPALPVACLAIPDAGCWMKGR